MIEFRGQFPSDGVSPTLFKVASLNGMYATGPGQAQAEDCFMAEAYEGARLVGVGQVSARGAGQAVIDRLIVDPQFRGWGIGSRLLRMLVSWCEEQGIHAVRLSATQASRGFFERNGFAALPESDSEMEYSRGWEVVGNGLGPGFVHALEHAELEALGS